MYSAYFLPIMSISTHAYHEMCFFFVRMCVSVEYNPNMSETDPKALFQQLIPQRFLTMQDRIKEEVEELRAEGKPPIMDDSAFRAAFQYLFDDEDELSEAVFFLNLQGKKSLFRLLMFILHT